MSPERIAELERMIDNPNLQMLLTYAECRELISIAKAARSVFLNCTIYTSDGKAGWDAMAVLGWVLGIDKSKEAEMIARALEGKP